MTTETLNKVNGVAGKVDNQLSKFSNDAGKKIGTMASDFADSASSYVADFADTASNRIAMGRNYVKENPATGIAIAAATGLVVGSLLTIALRRK